MRAKYTLKLGGKYLTRVTLNHPMQFLAVGISNCYSFMLTDAVALQKQVGGDIVEVLPKPGSSIGSIEGARFAYETNPDNGETVVAWSRDDKGGYCATIQDAVNDASLVCAS